MTPEQYFNKYGRLMPEKGCRKEKDKSFDEILESAELPFVYMAIVVIVIVFFLIVTL